MNTIQLASHDSLTDALSGRIQLQWDAYHSVDVPTHSSLLTDDYVAVHPDGTIHHGKPSAEEIAQRAIDRYSLTELRAFRLGDEAALVTYIAETGVGSHISPKTVKVAVGEVWVKQYGDWKSRYYQATTLK